MTDPITMPSPAEVWRNAEPSFRGAVIGSLQAEVQRVLHSARAARDRSGGDSDVIAMVDFDLRLADVARAAIEILREAAHG